MLHLMIYTTPSRMGNILEHRKLAFRVPKNLLIHGVSRTLKNFYSDEKHPGKRQILLKNCEELENCTITYRNNRDLRLENGNCP